MTLRQLLDPLHYATRVKVFEPDTAPYTDELIRIADSMSEDILAYGENQMLDREVEFWAVHKDDLGLFVAVTLEEVKR